MKLYAKDAKGKIRIWEINAHGTYGFVMSSGLLNGTIVNKTVRVEPKANRTQSEQITLEMCSRIKRKIDSGFTKDIGLAIHQERTNDLGFQRPMLAKAKVDDYDKINSHVQIKYNGLRCLITCRNGIHYAYSKSGILYTALDHILDDIEIPEGVTIDGELYHHGTHLQTINSWVKKNQPETKNLIYNCYDTISDLDFNERLDKIHRYRFGDSAIVVPTWNISDLNIVDKMQEVRSDGFEGLIVRQPGFGYQCGKRNTAMIKIKQFLDAEYQVLNITASKDNMAILHLEHKGKRFKVFAPGSHENKIKILENPEIYLGQHVEIEFAELSKGGVPQQPVAKHFRDFE